MALGYLPTRKKSPFEMDEYANSQSAMYSTPPTPTPTPAQQLNAAVKPPVNTNTAPPENWGGTTLPKSVTSGTLNKVGVTPGEWFNSNGMFYKAGESKGYTSDEYKDITQPGWRVAAQTQLTNQAAAGNVLVDDARGNKYFVPQGQAMQDSSGVWRPAGWTAPAPVNAPPAGTYTPPPGQAPGTGTGTSGTVPTGQTGQQPGQVSVKDRPISQAVTDLLAQIRAKLNATPVTADQIMNSAEYKTQADAIQAMSQRNADIAAARLRRSASSRNMLRSTPTLQALASSEADYALRSSADQAAMVPSMLTAAYNRQQNELKNLGSLLEAQTGVEKTAFDQGLSEFNATAPYNNLTQGQIQQGDQWNRTFNEGVRQWESGQTGKLGDQYTIAGREALGRVTGIDPVTGQPTFDTRQTEADITGNYLSPNVADAIDRVLAAKQNKDSNPDFWSAEERAALNELGQYGDVDASLFGPNVSYADAVQNKARVSLTAQAKKDQATTARQATQDANAIAATRAAYTGTLMLPEDQPILNEAIAAKQAYEQLKAQGVVEPDPRLTALALRASDARAKLIALGYPDVDKLIGSGVTATQAQANQSQVGYTKPQTAKEIRDEAIAKLQFEIDTSEELGLVTQAQLAKAKIEAETEKALRSGNGEALTPMQQYQIIRDATRDAKEEADKAQAKADKATEKDTATRNASVKAIQDEYNGVDRPAAEMWVDLMALATTPLPNGQMPTIKDLQDRYVRILQGNKIPLEASREWFSLMWRASRGSAEAATELNTSWRKNPQKLQF